MFEEIFLGHFFLMEFRDAKIREFLNLRQDPMTVQEYNLKFTQLSRYAPEMVVDMRNRMSLYVFGLGHSTKKEGNEAILIGDMNIGRLMTRVQHNKEEKMRDREEEK